jgi:hypothetical protein
MSRTAATGWLKRHAAIFACGLAAFVLAFLTVYRHIDSGDIDDAIRDSQNKLEAMRRNGRAALTLEADSTRLKHFAELTGASLMDAEAKPANLAYFYELGAARGVKVTHADQMGADAKKKTGLPSVRFNLGLQGAFPDVIAYVAAVRLDHPLMVVESFSMTPSSSAAGKVEEANLVIAVLSGTGEGKAK